MRPRLEAAGAKGRTFRLGPIGGSGWKKGSAANLWFGVFYAVISRPLHRVGTGGAVLHRLGPSARELLYADVGAQALTGQWGQLAGPAEQGHKEIGEHDPRQHQRDVKDIFDNNQAAQVEADVKMQAVMRPPVDQQPGNRQVSAARQAS